MVGEYIAPELEKEGFHCPNCGVYAHQEWYFGGICGRISDPRIDWNEYMNDTTRFCHSMEKWDHTTEKLDHTMEKFDYKKGFDPRYYLGIDWDKYMKVTGELYHYIRNLNNVPEERICACAHCKKHSFWIDGRMVFPSSGTAPLPHALLPEELQKDYHEARDIADISPRGAAALLRLVIQKLCKQLGQPGKNINADIGELVKQGLPKGVQEALDMVRVVGNQAVHPGKIDLGDKPVTVASIFELVNMIVEKMIAEPEKISKLSEKLLSENKRKAISDRDKKKQGE